MNCKSGNLVKYFNILISILISIASLLELFTINDNLNITYCSKFLILFIIFICASILNIVGLVSCWGISCTKINFGINFVINIALITYNINYINFKNDQYKNSTCIDYYKESYYNIWLLYNLYTIYQCILFITNILIIYYFCKE